LANAASAPPNMGMRVDKDSWACLVTISNPFCRQAIDEICRRRHKTLRSRLPKGDEPGTACELEYLASGRSLPPQTIGLAHN
jgi:hypothetical protein